MDHGVARRSQEPGTLDRRRYFLRLSLPPTPP
jgi:hypothetical protein